MIHCTGGAQTKVMKFVDQKRIVKNLSEPLAPLFQLLEEESGTDRKEMYQVFNMGHRLEVYTTESEAQSIIDIASSFDIDARVIGHVEDADKTEVVISDEKGIYVYS